MNTTNFSFINGIAAPSFLKENILPTLTSQHKKITLIASAILGGFILCLLGILYWTKSKNAVQIKVEDNPKIILSNESKDLLQRLKKINDRYFFRPDQVLMNKLKEVDPVELSKVLKYFFAEMIQEGRLTDPVKFLDRLATVIPLAKLQEAVKDDVGDALTQAKGMFEEAKHYLKMTNENTSPSIRERISSILDGIISVIETIITLFGIGEIFKPAENESHADLKSQKLMMLFAYFSMLSAVILPLLGAVTGGLIMGGTLLSIAALSIIWPYIKPKPTHLPANAENLTKLVRKGGFVAEGRKESLDEIANILKMNRHAILVGEPRVGKSVTALAFAQAIERSDYPELKGKVVFRINTADLIGLKASSIGGGNNILNRISAEMGRHRDDIILVLDEIHMACKNNEKIADQLKTFLDEGGEFRHVIGITTTKEYDLHVKDNNAFSLRFDKVDIENTNQDETLKILSDTVLASYSKPLIKKGALDHIYEKSCKIKDAPQPATSRRRSKQCINLTEKTQKSPTNKKITEVSNKIISLYSISAATTGGGKKEEIAKIAELEKEKNMLQEALSKEQKELEKLFKSKDLLNRVRKETYSSVLKIAPLAQTTLNAANEKQLKLFILLREFLGRSLETHIAETSRLWE